MGFDSLLGDGIEDGREAVAAISTADTFESLNGWKPRGSNSA